MTFHDERLRSRDQFPGGPVTVVGAGPIGLGWARLFSRAGLDVRVHDVSAAALEGAERRLARETQGSRRIQFCPDLADAVGDATFVQECATENLAAKRALFASLEEHVSITCVLASSSSELPMSAIGAKLIHPARALVLHPLNPPDRIPVVEVVPSEQTSPEVVEACVEFLRALDRKPIRCTREVPGFVVNRIQFALLREALALTREGVVSPEDLDLLVTDGLAPRWSALGPLATEVALNEDDSLERYRDTIESIFASINAESMKLSEQDFAHMRRACGALGASRQEILDRRDQLLDGIRLLKEGELPPSSER